LPEPFSAERLNQLRQRWERDPKSRAFLQLAEEYRRGGRLSDAVHVLEAGLEEHPTYLAAQVALGRCLLESGAPAKASELLERAVARDPTQLVANKLLVEAYLAMEQAGKARERLDLYKLFNDRDADIETLESRIRALDGLPAAPPRPPKRGAPGAASEGAVFHLPPVPLLPEVRLDLPAPARPLAGEPFGRLYASGAVHRIESALAEGGIFVLAPPRLSAPAPAAERAEASPATDATEVAPRSASPAIATNAATAATAATPASAASDIEGLETVFDVFEPESVSAPASFSPDAGMPVEAEPGPEAEVEPESRGELELEAEPRFEEPLGGTPAPAYAVPDTHPPASSTLGDLYLAQGHLAEAEESFQAVLRSRPDDAVALAGLQSVRSQRGEEAAAFNEETVADEEPHLIVGGLTARKASLLKDYLARIRRGGKRRVS
jgi:tetratricopeptide (TPR) repeat protein